MIAYHLTLYEQAKRNDAPINWYLLTIYAVSIHHYYFYVNWSCLSIIIFQTLLCTKRFFSILVHLLTYHLFTYCSFISISTYRWSRRWWFCTSSKCQKTFHARLSKVPKGYFLQSQLITILLFVKHLLWEKYLFLFVRFMFQLSMVTDFFC